MSDSKRARLILERWVAELPKKDRSKGSLASNFEELFEDLSDASIPFDDAHDIMKEAIKHHYPSKSVAKFTFKNVKRDPNQSFDEWLDGWKKLIDNEATQAFYAFYKVDGENKEKKEKKYGNMSVQEYSKQRKLADSFPTIDTDELQASIDKMLEEQGDIDE